ncbi:hypothetical protein L249_3405, partial [Ophiocordyceps polyrhachis-furcata BCC 54312]
MMAKGEKWFQAAICVSAPGTTGRCYENGQDRETGGGGTFIHISYMDIPLHARVSQRTFMPRLMGLSTAVKLDAEQRERKRPMTIHDLSHPHTHIRYGMSLNMRREKLVLRCDPLVVEVPEASSVLITNPSQRSSIHPRLAKATRLDESLYAHVFLFCLLRRPEQAAIGEKKKIRSMRRRRRRRRRARARARARARPPLPSSSSSSPSPSPSPCYRRLLPH